MEKGAFTTSYAYDSSGRRTFQQNPYFEEPLVYDLAGNLLQKGDRTFFYDEASQITSEGGMFNARYDQHYNCIWRNGEEIQVDGLNQRRDLEYDLNGNLLREGFIYDEFNQLIQTGTDSFTYDALGRRLASGETAYFYINDEEIGSFENGKIQELKVMGSIAPVAIEIENKVFAPIVDVQNTTRKLVNMETQAVVFENTFDAFGRGISGDIPYAYLGKRYDASTGLIYFGKRFYDPNMGRWLTQDPLGSLDHSNLYQYVFNNPYRHQDPNGENVIGFICGIGQIIAGAAIMASGVILEFASVGGYTVAFGPHELMGMGLIATGYATMVSNAQDITASSTYWKNSGAKVVDPGRSPSSFQENPKNNKNEKKVDKGKRFNPDPNAQGSHTVFRRDPQTGEVTKYETYQNQTNTYDPRPWNSVKRYDAFGKGDGHYNKNIGEFIKEPHVHDPNYAGGVRSPLEWEVPK